MILDVYSFCEMVLPRYFKHKNMASFVRQLNLCESTKYVWCFFNFEASKQSLKHLLVCYNLICL